MNVLSPTRTLKNAIFSSPALHNRLKPKFGSGWFPGNIQYMKINILRYILVLVPEVPGGAHLKSSGPVAYKIVAGNSHKNS